MSASITRLVSSARLDAAMASLLGAACGDAVGTTYEFQSREAVLAHPPTDMVGGGPFYVRPGAWTDDTAMACAMGCAMLDCPDGLNLSLDGYCRRFADWYQHGDYSPNGILFDIGGTTARSIRAFMEGKEPTQCASTNPKALGNGSVMRLSPIPIALQWSSLEELREEAYSSGVVTHGAPVAGQACQLWAALTAAALRGETREAVLDVASSARGAVLEPDSRIADIISGQSWRGRRSRDISGTGLVLHSMNASLWSLERGKTFKDIILRTVCLGDDTDTTAAIAGALVGPLVGTAGIPAEWRKRVAFGPALAIMAGELCFAGAARAAPQPLPRGALWQVAYATFMTAIANMPRRAKQPLDTAMARVDRAGKLAMEAALAAWGPQDDAILAALVPVFEWDASVLEDKTRALQAVTDACAQEIQLETQYLLDTFGSTTRVRG